MSLCKDCFVGVRHEGTPSGKIEFIGGVETYISLPEVEYPKNKAILFLTDAFGLPYANNKLLADDFARNGYQVFMPDLFTGDCFLEEYLSDPKFNAREWIARHGPSVTRPLIDGVITALQGRGITEFGATGYCFGGLYSVELATDNVVKAIAISHPSLLSIPDHFERLRSKSSTAVLINSCEVDEQFPPSAQAITDGLLGNGNYAPGYERTYWPRCTHGFAVRGDITVPEVKAAKEGSFKASVEWFGKYL